MLDPNPLIGHVAAAYFEEQMADAGDGTARFVLERLSPEQIAAIAKAILAHPTLATRFDLKLPRTYLAHVALPESVLTNERATFHRNEESDRAAVLLANVGDDEEQSLRDLSSLGAATLMDRADLWVSVAGVELNLDQRHETWWSQALRGLRALDRAPLHEFASYVLATRRAVQEGEPILTALGSALPALRLPKRSDVFTSIPERARNQVAKWRGVFDQTDKKCAPYLHKKRPDGTPLSDAELHVAFEGVKDDIDERWHATIDGFLRAEGGWTLASAALAAAEWEEIKPLFEGLRRTKKESLGALTLKYFDETADPDEAERLTKDDRDYLERLQKRNPNDPSDEDRDFYDAHRSDLRQERKLKAAWERFLFGKPREVDDLAAGVLAALESFDLVSEDAERTLTITYDKANARELFQELNVEAGAYFAARYRGLPALLGAAITWKVDPLFTFSDAWADWKRSNPKAKENTSTSKAALQLKFTVTLTTTRPGRTESTKSQFIWRFDPRWVVTEFADDWGRIATHPFQTARIAKAPAGGRSGSRGIDLRDVTTMAASFGRTQGTLVAKYDAARDVGEQWPRQLAAARGDALIDADAVAALTARWEAFQEAYRAAVEGFRESGVAAGGLETQAEAYAGLLEEVIEHAKSDRLRIDLLKPLLELGTVVVEGEGKAAIVAPWHPLRLAGMARKARRFASTVRALLARNGNEIGDARLFFREKREELAHPFGPEVTVVFEGDSATPLALVDAVGDYTLHEPAVARHEDVPTTNEDAQQGALQVLDLTKRYLGLQPHQRNNLSVVLYDCDSARLPTAVVEKLAALNEDEEHARCQVILRHGDKERLSRLYQQIVDVRDDVDTASTSEITSDFMARMRISIMAEQRRDPDPLDGRPEDIVFLQDVIARKATLEWNEVRGHVVPGIDDNPTQWSRRHPFKRGDRRSAVYLACPAQTRDGWAFLSGMAAMCHPYFKTGTRYLPARILNFSDPTTKAVLDQAHEIGTWVANFDELLGRRQLTELDIPVIRFKQLHTAGRSLIVSSKASLGLLRSTLRRRLERLGIEPTASPRIADELIRDANDVSGDIVLRAAKRGRNASELMGVVLSRYLVEHELSGAPIGFFFLDDYADWLGQRDEQIADVLALSPRRAADGARELIITIMEAKFIDEASAGAKSRDSAKQLQETLQRFAGALDQGAPRLDRGIWLNRLADLVVDGVDGGKHEDWDVAEWSNAIRSGDCRLSIRGYSHVFAHGGTERGYPSGATHLTRPGEIEAFQEVFEDSDLRRLIRDYANNADPTPLRETASGLGPRDLPWRGGARAAEGGSPAAASPAPAAAATPPAAPSAAVTVWPSGLAPSGAAAAAVPPMAGWLLPSLLASKGIDSVPKTAIPAAPPSPWPYPSVAAWAQAADTGPSVTADEEAWADSTFKAMAGALRSYQLNSRQRDRVLTPNAVLLRFEGSDRLTVEQVLKRRNEFLTTHALRIIDVQPEPGEVVIVVAREQRQSVGLSSTWKRWAPDTTDGNRTLLIGVRERDGELLILDPGGGHAPHTLIAGSTGSGKSVLMQNILLSIAATNTPEAARIILIDPKQGVDYFAFDRLPHLEGGGVIDRQEAATAHIERLVDAMEQRYTLMKQARASTLAAYNLSVAPAERLPVLWLIHDEFAEWMLTESYRSKVTESVARLGTKARAAGIHLVFAAQRPDNTVFPMQLRANLGNRLVLKVDGPGTSEIALGIDGGGAENLLGRGHLVAKLDGESSRIHAQVPYASVEEIAAVVEGIVRDSKA